MIRRFLGTAKPLRVKRGRNSWKLGQYFMQFRLLKDAEAGDLVFFGKITSNDAWERAVIDVIPGDMFHVAIVAEDGQVIHAAADGVVQEPLDLVVTNQKPHYIEVCRVSLPPSVKQMALSRAKDAIGCAYNDLFAPDHINSKGDKSFYCSQLITDAYLDTDMKFPEHFLQFGSGETLEYWTKFYEDRGRKLPQNEPGSHPSQIRKSSRLKRIVRSPKLQPFFENSNLSADSQTQDYRRSMVVKS